MSQPDKPFFVGYLPVPKPLQLFLWAVTLGLLAVAAGLGIWIGATQDEPGPVARFGNQTVSGVVELTPLPILHVTEGTDVIPVGHTLMLSSGGKNGVADRDGAEHGQMVTVSGLLMQRGTMDMMQLRGGRRGMMPIDGAAAIPEPQDLGRWKLAGEICDGKCLAGAMRPGRGLAHKACANLCVLGGVPPVFVSTQPVEGSEFLMITGPDGADLPQAVYDHMAQYISVEGQITQHGDLLVFALDPNTVEVLP